MAKHIKCGRVFSGIETDAQQDQTIVVEGDTITYVGASAGAPAKTKGDETVDFGSYLVLNEAAPRQFLLQTLSLPPNVQRLFPGVGVPDLCRIPGAGSAI